MLICRNKTNGKLKWQGVIIVATFCIATLCGCGRSGSSNFLSREGFIPPNAPLLLNESPGSLTSDIHYIVMNLTPTQAKSLLQKFKAKKPLSAFPAPMTPKQMSPSVTGNAVWKPQTVKKYWSGSFLAGKGSYPYHCRYVFDIAKPGTIILYFYAVSFYN